jgi:putative phage-type endonuclease
MTATAAEPTFLGLITPGSPEWMKLMTASKIAAVVGLSPYESRFSLWHRMAGMLGDQPDSDILRRGHYLEPAIAAWFADEHPEFDVVPAGTFAHPERPWQAASPDRLLIVRDTGETRLLECKSAVNADEWGEPGTDEIPAGYKAQVQWQLDTFGATTCHVAVLGAHLEFAEYLITADPEYAADLRAQALNFLASLPDGTTPQRPDIDAHNATYEAVRFLHPDIDDVDIDLDHDLVRDYCTARHTLAAAELDEKHQRSLIADALGSARRGKYLDQVIAQRQAKGDGVPYVVAGRNLPTFTDTRDPS